MGPSGRIAGGPTAERALGRPFKTHSFASRLLAVDRRTAVWAAALGAGIVVLAGVVLSAALNVWIDEAFTLHTTGAGPLEAWSRALDFEAQPPLYFLIEAAWRTVNETSIAFARLPSVLFAALAVVVVVGAAHRIIPRVPPAVVSLATVLNPLVLLAATEMRVYALVLLIGAALTWLFFEGFLVSLPARRWRFWYAIAALLGLYTQYYVGFVLAAHLITLLAIRRAQMRSFMVSMAIVAVGFAPFVPIALRDVRTSTVFVSRVSLPHAAHEVLNAVFLDVLPHRLEWKGVAKIAGFAVAAALLMSLTLFGRPVLADKSSRGLPVALLASVLLFSLLFNVSGAPLDPARHLIVIAPLALLSTYVFFASLTRGRRPAAYLAGCVFVAFAVGKLWLEYRPPTSRPGDWRRVAQLLSADDPAIPIAIFPAEFAVALNVYLPRSTIPVPRPMPFTAAYVRASTLGDEADVAHVLDPVYKRSAELWVVTADSCTKRNVVYYNYNCRFFEAYLNRKYRLVKTVVFNGSVTRLYVRGSAGRSDLRVRLNAN